MILRFYPSKDATIYEKEPSKNTGLDAILDISKIISTDVSPSGSVYNSRILLDFDYNTIATTITNLGYNPNQFNFSLKMYVAEANEIPLDYTLYAYPISQSWSMGIGRASNSPATTDGVSWYYRTSKSDLTSVWATGSYPTLVTGSWSSNPGGGTWFTQSFATQSFDYTTSDVDMNITSIVRLIQSGSISFNGIIIKKSDADEQGTGVFSSLKFFSKDTNTVYHPVIEARYDDSIITGSLSVLDTELDYNLVLTNLQSTYKEQSTAKVRVDARYRFPIPTFQTSSFQLTNYRLPSGSQYAVYSAQTDDVVINFSDYTKLSSDSSGNYFRLYLDSFQPERYYKLVFRVPNSGPGTTYQIYDKNWIFKVTR